MAFPYVFAGLGGNVPASYLDANFNATVQLGNHTANTVVGNNQAGPSDAVDLNMTQLYAMLKTAIPWEWATFQGGNPSSGWIINGYQSSTGVSIVQGSCVAQAGTAPAGNTSLPIKDGASVIGNVVFRTGNITGNVVLNASPYALVQGNRVTITNAGSGDGSISDINITLAGVRT